MTAEATGRPRVASVEEIRGHFPALERVHGGFPVAHFDGPGGTQVPRMVVETMTDYLYHHNANTHWGYPTSDETDAVIAGARGAFADFFNASADEIAFGLNMTSMTFHLARALGRGWSKGDKVVTTELEHHGNVGPWQSLAVERGVTVRQVKMIPDTGQLDWEDFEQAVTPKTKLVAVGAASNALGTINDVARAARLARGVGALVFVDAVHFAPHELVDVKAMNCDFLAVSAYKFYGPHIGVMFGKRKRFANVDYPRLICAPTAIPEIAETGTQNHEGIAGAGAAVDFLASLGEGATRREQLERTFASLHQRGADLTRRLWDGLSAIKDVTLFGPPPETPRTPTVAFAVKGVAPRDVSLRLAEKGVFASSGNFYAVSVMERLGHGRLVRAGCSCHTTKEEVDRLVAGVREIARA